MLAMQLPTRDVGRISGMFFFCCSSCSTLSMGCWNSEDTVNQAKEPLLVHKRLRGWFSRYKLALQTWGPELEPQIQNPPKNALLGGMLVITAPGRERQEDP